MNFPTIIIGSIIAIIFALIIIKSIRNKKQGKNSCSCGGNCGACGACGTNCSDKSKK